METLNKLVLYLHITAGFLSLAGFILPVIVKKGSRIHKLTGKFYVIMMWHVVLSAAWLSMVNLIEKDYIPALFLGYLAMITSNPLWYGIAVLKHGKEIPSDFVLKKKYFEMAVFFVALFNISVFIYYGGQGQTILLLIFGLLGLSAAPLAFRSVARIQKGIQPVAEHVEAMITTGIAAYTAFFVFGGYTFFESIYQGYVVVMFWTLPGIVGGIIISRFKRKYKRPPAELV